MHAAVQTALSERHYIQFHPVLADLLGGFKPALMLGHALYWTRNWMMTSAGGRDGWFWKTAAEWRDATGLSPREQEGARQVLRDAGIWHEALIGQPHGQGTKLHFRVDLSALTKALTRFGNVNTDSSASAGRQAAETGGDGPAVLTRFLRAPVMYYRSLADVAGGAGPGLLLSWLLIRMREAISRMSSTADGFFLFELDSAQQRLRLGPKVLRNARETLERIGLISVGYAFESRGRLMVRVNLLALTACLSGQKPGLRKRVVGGRKLEPVVVQEPLSKENESANRAQVVSQDANITHVGRILFGRALPAVQPLAAVTGGPTGTRKPLKTAGSRFAVLSKRSPQDGMSTCRFVEMGGAVLSNLYTKGLDSKPTTPTAGASPQGHAEGNEIGRSRRSSELSIVGELPDKQPARQDVLAPRNDLLPSAEEIAATAVRMASEVREQQACPAHAAAVKGATAAPALAEGADLIMPKRLDAALHDAAKTMVQDAPVHLRQGILDELEGSLASKRKTIESPLGWLNTVVTKACRGDLRLTVAYHVAQARDSARKQAEALAQASGREAKQASETTGPLPLSPEAQAGREKLQALTNRMRAGMHRRGGDSA